MPEEKKQKLNEYQKNYRETFDFFDFYSFHCIKNGTRSCVFWRNGIIVSAFHKHKNPINVNEVDIE